MGLFRWLNRRTWKNAVVDELHRKYGINIRAVGDLMTPPGSVEEILNMQYELTTGPFGDGAKNVDSILYDRGVDLPKLAMIIRMKKSAEDDKK